MPTNRFSTLSLAAALALFAACGTGDGDDADAPATTTTPPIELDVIGLSERPASLLVLDASAAPDARARLTRALDQIGGAVISALPPRLLVAQVPDGAGAILAAHGVVARHDRPLADGELPGASIEETRFVAVYSNRWHAPADPIVATARVLAPDEPFEATAEHPADAQARFAPGEPGPQPDPEDLVSVPYASGTVVVAVLLPESNGAVDASTEDWSEEMIRATYLKIQAGLDVIAAAEPNAKLRYVLHFESRPGAGGLPGTIDSDYEFGRRSVWGDWTNENLATAHLLQRIYPDADPANPWPAMQQYQLDLRRQYNADAAFAVVVAPNANFTSGIRPHAWIGGPWTVLDSQTGWEVFAHEFGHIFGALDEYCPDACSWPTSLQGYLGIYNANAEYREGEPGVGGINDGRGEAAPSLMQYNQVDHINGYTRTAWGWLDVDGDGVVDVRDTFPRSELRAEVTGQVVRLTGQVVDVPAVALWRTRYSANRLTRLDVEIVRAGATLATLELPLAADTRGRQAVDLALPALSAGSYELRLRAHNDVGNVERTVKTLPVTITGTTNVAPIAQVTLPTARALSSGASYTVAARAVDPEGGTARVRIDLGGDGSFETAWATTHTLAFTPSAGVHAIVVEARDTGGRVSRQRFERLVFAGNAPPEVSLAAVPGVVHGTNLASVALAATATDADGTTPELAWRADLVTADGTFREATGFGAASTWTVGLPTPEKIKTTKLHLAAGDWSMARSNWIRDVLALDAHTLAVAAGHDGIWFLDIANPTAPVVISRLQLETMAHSLLRKGNRLYVLGTMVTVVDIADLTAPRELKQLFATSGTRTTSMTDVMAINEGEDWGGAHWLYVQDGERITDTRITLTVDHPRHADLVFTLTPPKQLGLDPIVLREHRPAPAGVREYTFTSANTPALRALDGAFATEGWMIQVKDDVLNGNGGALLGSTLRFATRSRAAAVLPSATHLIGTLSGGELVVGGAGVQVLDVSWPQWITQLSRVRGTATSGAVLVGDTVVWGGPQVAKSEDPNAPAPVLRGLAAIDLDFPWSPWIVRVDDGEELGMVPNQIAKIGNRLYVDMTPWCPEPPEGEEPGKGEGGDDCGREDGRTWVGNANAFASGYNHWVLGESTLRVDRNAFGNGQRVWTVGNGYVQQLDVSDPANLRVAREYPQSWAAELVRLGTGGDVLLFQFGLEAYLGNLDVITSTLSRTYRLTVEARDAAGAITRASKTVHVIPYDHAPTADSVAQTAGAVAGDNFGFQVFATDPDRAFWDPALLVTADWDNDGVMDADPTYFSSGAPGELWHVFDAPGTYPVTFEVRDGFWARATITTTVVVQ